MELAKEDSASTGNRFVVENEGSVLWGRPYCVVDAKLENVVASGIKYYIDARQLAAELEKAHYQP